jgi:hypothetical protein
MASSFAVKKNARRKARAARQETTQTGTTRRVGAAVV